MSSSLQGVREIRVIIVTDNYLCYQSINQSIIGSAQGLIFHCKLSILHSTLFSAFLFVSPYSPFVKMLSIIWYLLLQRTFFTFTIPSRESFSRQFLLSQWPSQFYYSSLSVPALLFLLPLCLAQLHFLFCLSILHAPSFSIYTSQMLPVVLLIPS